jgi:hypothetical protein
VTDLFYGELAGGGVDAQMRFMLRPLGLMSRPNHQTVFSRYYDLLLNVWSRVIPASEFDPGAVFLRHTG